jgi:uncharacterized protein YggE
MTRQLACFSLLASLAACGVDGAPTPPAQQAPAPQPGVTVTGDAQVGIVGLN